MTDKIKASAFTEETYWVAPCPECGEMIEVYEEPRPGCMVDVYCKDCDTDFEIEEG